MTAKENKFDFSLFITMILIIEGVINHISYIIWACSSDTTGKWFDRLFLSIVCFGFAGVISAIRKKSVKTELDKL